MTRISVEVRGIPELRRKLGPELPGAGAQVVLERASEKIERTAVDAAPRRLRGNIRREVMRGVFPRQVTVRLTGAGKRELAIHGPMSGGRTRTRPFRPPLSAPELVAWAREHGMPPGALAGSIAKRGTPFKPFMRKAREGGERAVQEAVPEGERAVKRKWDS